jgi:hypothetical protein
MDYKAAISQNTDKKQLSFNELAQIITGLSGDERPEGTMEIDGNKLDKILQSILGEDGTTAAWFHYNTPEVQARLNWHYEVNEGEGYYTVK